MAQSPSSALYEELVLLWDMCFIRERRKNNLCCCSCHYHQRDKWSYMSEETFLLWGLYVPRVKSKPAARERPFHDNCFSLPSISERGQERHLKTRGFVLIVTEAPGDITGYRRLHTSRGGLRLCLPGGQLPSRVAPRPCSTCLAKQRVLLFTGAGMGSCPWVQATGSTRAGPQLAVV